MADDTKVDFYFYYHSNHLGSTNFVTRVAKSEDEDKPRHEMYEHVEYIPFGETWIEGREVLPFGASKSNRYLFTSKEFDQETRLYYYGARYYDPKTSIWLSADPALGKYLPTFPTNERKQEKLSINPIHYWAKKLPGMGGVFRSFNLNLYKYASQNPVRYIDPNGTDDWESFYNVDAKKAMKQMPLAAGLTLAPLTVAAAVKLGIAAAASKLITKIGTLSAAVASLIRNKLINRFVDKLVDKFKGNPTIQRHGKDLFRIRRRGHPKGNENSSVTNYTHHTNPKTGQTFPPKSDKKVIPVTKEHIKMIKKALKGKDGYSIRRRGEK